MSILQYIRYFVIGLIPFSIIIIIINAIINYGFAIALNYIDVIFGIIVLAYLTIIYEEFGTTVVIYGIALTGLIMFAWLRETY